MSKAILMKSIRLLNYIEEGLLVFIFSLLTIFICIEIISRLMNSTAFYWLEEFGKVAMVLGTFLGASLAIKYDKHPGMTLLLEALPAKANHLVQALTNLICSGIFAYFDFYAWAHVARLTSLGVRTITLGIPLYVMYLPVAIFCIGIFIRFLLRAVKELRLLFV